jgi:hypothetical protein
MTSALRSAPRRRCSPLAQSWPGSPPPPPLWLLPPPPPPPCRPPFIYHRSSLSTTIPLCSLRWPHPPRHAQLCHRLPASNSPCAPFKTRHSPTPPRFARPNSPRVLNKAWPCHHLPAMTSALRSAPRRRCSPLAQSWPGSPPPPPLWLLPPPPPPPCRPPFIYHRSSLSTTIPLCSLRWPHPPRHAQLCHRLPASNSPCAPFKTRHSPTPPRFARPNSPRVLNKAWPCHHLPAMTSALRSAPRRRCSPLAQSWPGSPPPPPLWLLPPPPPPPCRPPFIYHRSSLSTTIPLCSLRWPHPPRHAQLCHRLPASNSPCAPFKTRHSPTPTPLCPPEQPSRAQ